jgi:hypothetical protein
VETMLRYGYEEIYEGRSYTVLNIDDMKYWTMRAPIPETILINRKILPPFADLTGRTTPGAVYPSPTCGIADQHRVGGRRSAGRTIRLFAQT